MLDQTILGVLQRAVHAASPIVCFTATGKRGSMLFQMAQALLVLAKDHTAAPSALTACGRERRESVSI